MNVYFLSLGCDKNLVDSEIMLGILGENGFSLTDEPGEAEIIIINTCGFINDANKESVNSILELAEYKKTGVCKALIVTGCMAQRYKDKVLEEMPEINAIVGVSEYASIASVVKDVLTEKKVSLVSESQNTISEDFYSKRVLSTPAYFAFIKIAEGCDNSCTYCTIPSIRGKYKSRSMEGIMAEGEMLAKKGVKEIILVAQDTSLYGTDIYGENRLHLLLRGLSSIEGIEWIRILYAYPEHITDETIIEMAENKKVCHYLDMPIQHASDTVLKRMGRKSSNSQLRKIISKLREVMPDISLRTTLITGFPGETEEEFNCLKDFVTEIKFDKCGVFAYSKEEGTPASKMREQVPAKVKKQRMKEIMALQKEISGELLNKQVGKTLDVIVDGKISGKDVYAGRSYRDSYEIDGVVFFEYPGELISGDFVKVKIIQSADYDLYGEMLYESAE